jgi:hypothetical protein
MPALGLGLGLALANLSSRKFAQIAFVGDSITRYIGGVAGGGQYQDTGFQTHARTRSGSGFDLVTNPNDGSLPYFATSGGRLYYQANIFIPGHIDSAIASGAKCVFLHGGTNDVQSGTDVPGFIAAYQAQFEKCRNAGVFFIGSTLVGPSVSLSAPTTKALYASVNAAIRSLGASAGFPVCDFAAATTSGTDGETADIYIASSFGGDNLHPTPLGMSAMGHALAETLNPRLSKASVNQFWRDIANGVYGLEISDGGGYLFPTSSSGIPTGYSFTLAAGGSSATHARVTDTDGTWWSFNIVDTTKTAEHLFQCRAIPNAGHKGTAQAGSSTTITLASGASAVNSAYSSATRNDWIWITSGTGAGQVRRITGYVGSTRIATVDVAWVTAPDNTSVYEVGTRTGERYITACELELDPSFQLRGVGLLVRSQTTPQNICDSASGGAAITIMPSEQPATTRMMVFRSTPVAVTTTSDRFSCRLRLVGQGSGRLKRLGMWAVDRTAGQLTFTP